MAAVAALPHDTEICGCNGVCKSKIDGAIMRKGLTSLDDVRAHAKASASCGSFTGLVEQLMKLALGTPATPVSGKDKHEFQPTATVALAEAAEQRR